MPSSSPAPFKRYRLLTGPDDAAFCQRVSTLIDQGFELHGSPSLAYDPIKQCVIAAQSIVWPADRPVPRNDQSCDNAI